MGDLHVEVKPRDYEMPAFKPNHESVRVGRSDSMWYSLWLQYTCIYFTCCATETMWVEY